MLTSFYLCLGKLLVLKYIKWCRIFCNNFSILQTAIANGIDGKLYLKTLIEKIGSNPTEKELENLLPWKIEL